MNASDLLRLESWDHQGGAYTTQGRGGTPASGNYTVLLPSSPSLVYCGVAIGDVGAGPFASVLHLTRSDHASHWIGAQILSDGRLFVIGAGIEDLDVRLVSDPLVHKDLWYHVEVCAQHVNAEDNLAWTTMQVRVNEAIVAQGKFTHLETAPEGKAGFDMVMGGRGGGTQPYFDDFYATLDGYLGDGVVRCLYPASDDSPLEWAAKSAGSHYEEANEHPPDDDTSFVYTFDADKSEMFGLTAPDPPDDIGGIQLVARASSEDSGKFRFRVKVDGVLYEYAEDFVPDAWDLHRRAFRCDPNDSTQFSAAEVQTLVAGFRRRV